MGTESQFGEVKSSVGWTVVTAAAPQCDGARCSSPVRLEVAEGVVWGYACTFTQC